METDVKIQQEISREIWIWFKQHLSMSNTDSDWKRVMASGTAIVKQYDNKLAEDLYFAYLDELERLAKGL